MRVETLKYFLIFVTIFFAVTSAQAQKSSVESILGIPSVDGKAGDRIGKAELVIIGRKYVDIWMAQNRRKSAEKWFQSDYFGLWNFTLYTGSSNPKYRLENEKNLLRLTKEFREGNIISGKLLGLFMYKKGKRLWEFTRPLDHSDPEALALLFAAQHFGFLNATEIINSRYYLYSDGFVAKAKIRSQEYIHDPLLLFDLPQTRCLGRSDRLTHRCRFDRS